MSDRTLTPTERGLLIGCVSMSLAYCAEDTELYTDLTNLREKLQLTLDDIELPEAANPLAFI